MSRTVEWDDRAGHHVLVLDAGLTFPVDPLPERHAFDPEVRRYMNGPAVVEALGPCLGCLPYRFPEDHPIHNSDPS